MTKFIISIAIIFANTIVQGQTKFNKELSAVLDSIYQDDQSGRIEIDSLQKIYGWQSEQVQSLVKKMVIKDSVNLQKVRNIIDNYGWLGPDEVGKKGAQTIFLIVQHADSITQENYLPFMREAVKKGKAEPRLLALLEDRVLVNRGKDQIYGSQVRTNELGKNELYPIVDEVNVNKRRASVGLNPLEEYAKNFGINYVLPKQKGNK